MKMKEAIDKRGEAKCRSIVCSLAFAGVMVAIDMIAFGANAQPKAQQKTLVPNVDIGAGIDMETDAVRTRAVLGLQTKLKDGLTLGNGFGIATMPDGSVKSEEVNTDLQIRVLGPLTLRAFGQNSRHLGIQKFSFSGEIGLKLQGLSLLAGTRYITDHGQILPFGGMNMDIVQDHLSLLALGGHTTNTDTTIARLGLTAKVAPGLPAIVIDSFNTIKDGKVMFSDLTAGLRFTF